MTIYRLWDTEIRKYLAMYQDARDAATFVQSFVRRYGDAAAEELSLAREEDGRPLETLTGNHLVEWVASELNVSTKEHEADVHAQVPAAVR